ncbi:DNA recombination protein RmuC [Kaistia algarum]|uniref:DNA recombination protein RmuC n=1 Tax=Kaistia algarum TaxID=2083279 RepID=UPI000CE88791|nr:DNA recombination protein RmuC [Kaistia algarum]MCX5516626.1 DNA recombination protein RmuC [Kaistia algarum]PPE77773.1 DNA recombination protein RmuC [Kaistia algarum]
MQDILFSLAGRPITLAETLLGGAGLALLMLFLVLVLAWRGAARRAALEADQHMQGAELQQRIADLVRIQSEMTGRMQTMAEVFGSRQSDLVRGLSERLDGFGHRIGQSMNETTRNTHEGLSRLHERLAVIDNAQRNITELSSQVVGLQQILANKQTRGAFGQGRMEAIIQDGLPAGGYAFQATLSNGNRPDCVVAFPNGAPDLVIDAKFPLEAWNAIRAAEGGEFARAAEVQFRRDVTKHVKDIAERYLIPGETQDTAFMFVPSESVFAEIHERFEDVVQAAHRLRVVIVSPSLLMLSIQVLQSVLRDVRMREQAHLIQGEVLKLMEDVGRVDERVLKLQAHFGQASKDIDDILISTRKLKNRGARIEQLEFGEEGSPAYDRQGDLLAGE